MLSEFETLLDESASYVLVHVYESVYLQERATGRSFTVGDHYGDPVKGIIGPEEDWFISFGEGCRSSLLRMVASLSGMGTARFLYRMSWWAPCRADL